MIFQRDNTTRPATVASLTINDSVANAWPNEGSIIYNRSTGTLQYSQNGSPFTNLISVSGITAGTNISVTSTGTSYTISTINNPTFTTSVTTPLLQLNASNYIQLSGTDTNYVASNAHNFNNKLNITSGSQYLKFDCSTGQQIVNYYNSISYQYRGSEVASLNNIGKFTAPQITTADGRMAINRSISTEPSIVLTNNDPLYIQNNLGTIQINGPNIYIGGIHQYTGTTLTLYDNLACAVGITIDGVDLSAFYADYISKINQALLTTSSPTFLGITTCNSALVMDNSGGASNPKFTLAGTDALYIGNTSGTVAFNGSDAYIGGIRQYAGTTLTLYDNLACAAGVTIDGIDISADIDQAVTTTSSPTFRFLNTNAIVDYGGNFFWKYTYSGTNYRGIVGRIDSENAPNGLNRFEYYGVNSTYNAGALDPSGFTSTLGFLFKQQLAFGGGYYKLLDIDSSGVTLGESANDVPLKVKNIGERDAGTGVTITKAVMGTTQVALAGAVAYDATYGTLKYYDGSTQGDIDSVQRRFFTGIPAGLTDCYQRTCNTILSFYTNATSVYVQVWRSTGFNVCYTDGCQVTPAANTPPDLYASMATAGTANSIGDNPTGTSLVATYTIGLYGDYILQQITTLAFTGTNSRIVNHSCNVITAYKCNDFIVHNMPVTISSHEGIAIYPGIRSTGFMEDPNNIWSNIFKATGAYFLVNVTATYLVGNNF